MIRIKNYDIEHYPLHHQIIITLPDGVRTLTEDELTMLLKLAILMEE